MPPVVRWWHDGQTAIAHCWQRFGRLTMCCYLVKGNITLLLFMQNAILKYKGLPIIVIVVLHFNPRSGMRYPNIHCVTGKGFCLKKNKKIYFGTMASNSITAGEAQPQYT